MIFACYAFSFLIIYCHGIAEEYYDDRNIKEIPLSTNNTPDSLRGGERLQNSSSDQNMMTEIRSNNSDYDYGNDDEFEILVIGSREKNNSRKAMSSAPTEESTTDNHNTSQQRLTYTIESNITTQQSALHFFSDYQYIYDEDTTKQPLLFSEDVAYASTPDTVSNTDSNKTKAFHTDFYNLDPAAVFPKFNDTAIPDNRMWYVPEKYPCWELPALYGELGRKKKTSEIFLVSTGNLKNVVTLKRPHKLKYKPMDSTNTAGLMNKWCSVQPCYGDHTLCLFADNYISKVCDSKYKVFRPTILEHIAFVNLINTMRNRIANGAADEYPQLPPARNMKQIIYDYDLEKMAAVWLRQCLPGPPPCSALDGQYVTQLECTKYADECCVNSYKMDSTSRCIPKEECYVPAIIGCIYAWFLSAGKNIRSKDIKCGHIDALTYNTAQLIWADSAKVGCAYGKRSNGDTRVVCDFSPGAPYFLITKYYCGFISHRDITNFVLDDYNTDLTNLTLLSSLGLNLQRVDQSDSNKNFIKKSSALNPKLPYRRRYWSLDSLHNLYSDANIRKLREDYSNGTKGMIAKLVTRYKFFEESESRCDNNEPVYIVGEPGSLCVETSRRFHALCYDFRDPTPGYRLVAVVAPVALFTLILYDLFSGVVRQTNY